MPIYMKIEGVKGDMNGAPTGPDGIIAILIGLVQKDAFEFESRESPTGDDAPFAPEDAGFNAGGGWDPTSIASPRDPASGITAGYFEPEWLDV